MDPSKQFSSSHAFVQGTRHGGLCICGKPEAHQCHSDGPNADFFERAGVTKSQHKRDMREIMKEIRRGRS